MKRTPTPGPAVEVRALGPDAGLAALLLRGLGLDTGDGAAVAVLGGVRDELRALATFTMCADHDKAADMVNLPEDVGRPLDAMVRRLDVALELLGRVDRGGASRRVRVRQR